MPIVTELAFKQFIHTNVQKQTCFFSPQTISVHIPTLWKYHFSDVFFEPGVSVLIKFNVHFEERNFKPH